MGQSVTLKLCKKGFGGKEGSQLTKLPYNLPRRHWRKLLYTIILQYYFNILHCYFSVTCWERVSWGMCSAWKYMLHREEREQWYSLLLFLIPPHRPRRHLLAPPHRGSSRTRRAPCNACGCRMAAALMPFVASSAPPEAPKGVRSGEGAGMGESRVLQHLCRPLVERHLALRSGGGLRAVVTRLWGGSAALAPALALLSRQCVCILGQVPPYVRLESSHLQSEDRESCRF